MATVNQFTATPNPAPSGQASRVTVTFNTAPAEADWATTITLTFANGTQATIPATLTGKPAESTPDVQVGATGVGWEIRTSLGILRRVSQNVFDLTRT